MAEDVCCTCASFLSAIPPQYTEKEEKPTANRRMTCCGRIICGECIADNSRFATYCPFCQVSTGPSALPVQGLRDPPSYSPPSSPRSRHVAHALLPDNDQPPAYSAVNTCTNVQEKEASESQTQDVLHFIDPCQDTIQSISLRYGVPHDALRRKNGLFADHLLAARRTILIPGEFYKGGVSLSPRPIEGEEEEMRKAKVRRWMVACKVADIPMSSRYSVALLYLQQAKYDLDAAIEAYLADEKWEKANPMAGSSKGKANQRPGRRKFGVGGDLTQQI